MKKEIKIKLSTIILIVLIIGIILTIIIQNNKNGKIASIQESSVKATQEEDYFSTELKADGTLTLKSYNKGLGLQSIVIPEVVGGRTVTEIGANCFLGADEVTSVTIPGTIKTIGDAAFQYCSNLTSVSIPDGLTYLGKNAFLGCSKLTNVNIPSAIQTLENGVFAGCGFSTITIPSNITRINDSAFATSNISSITIPDTVTSMGASVFQGCKNLSTIQLNSTLTSLGEGVFKASGLQSITIPQNIKNIGNLCFLGCTSLTNVNVQSGVNTIGNKSFANCTSLSVINLPNTVTTISNDAFTTVSDNLFGNNITGKLNIIIECGTNSYAYTYAVSNGFTFVFTDLVEKIEIITLPTKRDYTEGDVIDLSGGVIKVKLSDGSERNINMTEPEVYIVNGPTTAKVGQTSVQICYAGRLATFEITVKDKIIKALSSINVKTPPTKTEYSKGSNETLDLSGGVLKVTYSDGNTDTMSMTQTGITTSGFDISSTGTKTIILTYGGKTASFTIRVNEQQTQPTKTLSSIRVQTQPTKREYTKGSNEQLSLAGGVLGLTYSDGSTSTLSMTEAGVTTSGFSNNRSNNKWIQYSYNRFKNNNSSISRKNSNFHNNNKRNYTTNKDNK